jgi:hypothetical protein
LAVHPAPQSWRSASAQSGGSGQVKEVGREQEARRTLLLLLLLLLLLSSREQKLAGRRPVRSLEMESDVSEVRLEMEAGRRPDRPELVSLEEAEMEQAGGGADESVGEEMVGG